VKLTLVRLSLRGAKPKEEQKKREYITMFMTIRTLKIHENVISSEHPICPLKKNMPK
jgi:hypothetical protein